MTVTLEDIRDAAAGLAGVAVRTALIPVDDLADRAGWPVYLKPENQQPSGAFKLRGAWTAIRRLPDAERARGVVTYSSGNHGQAVAFAAQRLGIRAVIVMPETAPATKIEGVRKWGGEVEFAGTTSEDRYLRALEIIETEGLAVIPPFDHPDIIAGQGTVGLEIAEDLPQVRHVLVPVGGGGVCAGVSVAISALCPTAAVHAVEPVGSAAYRAAFEAGKPVRLERTASVADGLLPLSVGNLTFEHMRDIAQPVTVSDAEIVEATRYLAEHTSVVAEPSGAATTAALRAGVVQVEGPTVIVVTGGNVDPATIPDLQPVS